MRFGRNQTQEIEMIEKNVRIIKTGDGSDTLYLIDLDETYHSLGGAYNETRHVFIRHGLYRVMKTFSREIEGIKSGEVSPWIILDIGFGTGLNTALTIEQMIQHNFPIIVLAIEPHPLPLFLVKKLNYQKFLGSEVRNLWLQLHEMDWDRMHRVGKNIDFMKLRISLEQFDLAKLGIAVEKSYLTLIYHDGFAPSKQQSIWREENFNLLATLSRKNSGLVSYSASRLFRNNAQKGGWQCKSLPGAMGKREMTYATLAN